MAGRRVNLADLAGEPLTPEARQPNRLDPSTKPVRLALVSPNPLNTRDLDARPERVTALADSIRENGQLQPCAVVTRAAFLKVFPEYGEAVAADVDYVQVTGARRYAALAQLGSATIDVTVKDALAESRIRFLSATAAENIDRDDYDLIEEARAVEQLVGECGSGQEAAARLRRTPGWVTQRTNLLKLVPALQHALRTGEMPLREVRNLHKASDDEQLAALAAWRRIAAARSKADTQRVDGSDEHADSQIRTRRSPRAAAIHRLGGTPDKIASALHSELAEADLHQLVRELIHLSGYDKSAGA